MAKPDKCKECGHLTMKLSWSGLRTHEECKQRGHLQRSGKQAPLSNTRVFFPGTVTDRVVRDWLADDPYSNPGLMPQMVETIMERERELISNEGGVMLYKDKSDRQQILKDCIEAVTKIEPALNEFVLPYDYQVDFRFQAPVTVPHPDGGMETVLLIGYMDIITRETIGGVEHWDVWDVKHTRDDYYWKKTAGQLGFYDLSTELMFGSPTRRVGLLQPLCKEKVKSVGLDSNSRSQLMQRVIGMANDIWLDHYEPRIDNTLCSFCSVKHACSKFTPVLDKKGNSRVAF